MMNHDRIRRILYKDPIWSAYAIADLNPAVADSCVWYTGEGAPNGDEGVGEAVVMFFCAFQPPVLFVTGPVHAVAHALQSAQLPEEAYVSIRGEHESLLMSYYDFAADRRPMVRMVLRRGEQPKANPVPGLVRLHSDDFARLKVLYAQGGAFAPDAFDAYQLASGVFYGVEGQGGELLAAGGTHIVDWEAGIGAIGNFYTRGDARRHGYASALLSAIVRDLSAGFVDTIVLNVDQRNVDANHLYERHGFVVHCPFVEGAGKRVTR